MDILTALGGRRARKDVTVEMLDYGYVEQCDDVEELKAILEVLRSGKEGRYPELEQATERQLISLLPEGERQRVLRLKSGPSAEDVQEAKSQIGAFLEDISKVDEQLKQTKRQGEKRLPPVRGTSGDSGRNTSSIAERAEDRGQEVTKETAPSRISAYDFRAWEKFDVEKAVAEVEQAEEREEQRKKENIKRAEEQRKAHEKRRKKELEALPSRINLNEYSEAEIRVLATREKEKGNECFKAGELEEAFSYYSRSIALYDGHAAVYCNRALVALKQENFQRAEEDCTRAIELDPAYVKAWSRRGTARHKRGRYADAISDFKHALSLQPQAADVQKMLQAAEKKWKEVEGETASLPSDVPSADIANKAPTERPKEKFRRVCIIEEEEDEETEELGDNQEGVSKLQNGTQDGEERSRAKSIGSLGALSVEDEYEKISVRDISPSPRTRMEGEDKEEEGFTRISIREHSDEEEEGEESYESLPVFPEGGTASAMRRLKITEDEESQEEEVDHGRADTSWEARVQEARRKKAEGNSLAQAGRRKEAIECYSIAIDQLVLCPQEEVIDDLVALYSNRAACFLQPLPSSMSDSSPAPSSYNKAIEDCNRALLLNKSAAKALLRRGLAKMALGRWGSAEEDFGSFLSLSANQAPLPGVTAEMVTTAKESLAKVQQERARERGVEDKEAGAGDVNGNKSNAKAKAQCPQGEGEKEAKTVSQVHRSEKTVEKTNKQEESEEEKNKGNACFKEGDLSGALRHYSTSLSLHPTNLASRCNRAMVWLKMEKYQEAAEDCSQVLRAEQGNIKALYRRGVAHLHMENYRDAVGDFEALLTLEPENKQAKSQLSIALDRAKKRQTGSPPSAPPPSTPIATKREKDTKSTRIILEETATSDQLVRDDKQHNEPPKTRHPAPPTASRRVEAKGKVDTEKALAAVRARSSGSTFSTPKTSTEYERAWKTLHGDLQAFHRYLKMVPPSRYTRLFKYSFNADIFSTILATLQEYTASEDPAFTLDLLDQLTKVNRFNMAIAFLTPADKEGAVFGQLERVGEEILPKEAIEDVKRHYGH